MSFFFHVEACDRGSESTTLLSIHATLNTNEKLSLHVVTILYLSTYETCLVVSIEQN